MADANDIQRDLKQLESELKKLEAEYNMFFAGRLPRPPWETRGRVDAIVKRWDRGYIQASVDRFRFNTLQTRYSKFCDLWDRGLRAKEEGRPGPFVHQLPPPAEKKPPPKPKGPQVVHQAAFSDPMKEMDKLHALYDSLMDARRAGGEDVVPFHKFTALVKDQVKKIRATGSSEVAFRVVVDDGKVSFTAKGTKAKSK